MKGESKGKGEAPELVDDEDEDDGSNPWAPNP